MTYLEAVNRLHHLSMRYAGAMMELVKGEPVGFIHQSHPGMREARDFIDLILFTRAEINGLTRVLVEAELVSPEELEKIFAEEYEHFANEKANYLGVEITEMGLVFPIPAENK